MNEWHVEGSRWTQRLKEGKERSYGIVSFHIGERKTPEIREKRNGKDMHCGLPNKALDRENACILTETPERSIYVATMFTREPVVAHNGDK